MLPSDRSGCARRLRETSWAVTISLVLGAMLGPALVAAESETLRTTSGAVTLEKGLPATARDSQALYDELDFQRATQAYLWALPIVSFAQWQHEHETVFGAKDAELVSYVTYRDRLGILTANATTPYILTFVNLGRTGPLVVDSPAGPTAAGVGDFWQRPITDIGQTGPDKGQGGKYLIVGPGQEPPQADGYYVVHSPTVNIMIGFRALDPDPARAQSLIEKIQLYPFARRDTPPPTRLIPAGGKPFYQGQPRGMPYWERLHAILQQEPVETRDRMLMAMLAPLGIEKGKPFQPDERQQGILTRGAELGELMAMNFSFNKRFAGARYRPDTHWDYVLTMDPGQEAESYTQLDERSAWFYEAVTATKGMKTSVPGVGQAYLGAYHDAQGRWLDGGRSYKLRVPAEPPAKQFWSLTLYDTRTRALVENTQGVADRSSRMDLAKNPDGSVDLYMGPKPPVGLEKNWIPTVPGKAWFAYFRLYAPTEGYFDQSWKLPDIEPVD